jgi:hypothetical protein
VHPDFAHQPQITWYQRGANKGSADNMALWLSSRIGLRSLRQRVSSLL